jgi:outer membrane protein assembly factor BamA
LNQTSLQINVLGADFRHYQKIHRQIIFAGRFAANTSFGPGKVVYYLGGVENWMGPQFNNEIATSADQNYIFQALACNLRGFTQNIRNGNSYALASAEVRVPIFQYALNRPLRSEFFNHFQIVPFFDVGSAWVGSNPYSDENTFNQKIYEQGPIKAKVINVRDPIVAGFGGGLRSKLFGYFLRFDTAWGIQDFEVADKPIYYFSLSLDF